VRLIVPYTGIQRPEILRALASSGRSWEATDVRAEGAYADLVASLWRQGQDFCLVDGDMLIRPDCLDVLEACPAPWCGFCYPHSIKGFPFLMVDMAFIRFRAEVMERFPKLLEDLEGSWSPVELDAYVRDVLMSYGLGRHEHGPQVHRVM
jgi:hypothetical protein